MGNTLYVGTHGGHFAVYNVTNRGAAVLVGMVDVSDPVWDIALIGTNAVVALGRAGIGLVDVSVPNPSVLIPGSGITNDWATRVRTVGNRVYSNRGTALRVRDLTGALTFANVATVDAGDWVTDIAVALTVMSTSRVRLKQAFPFVLGIGIWFSPIPEGLTAPAWHLFAVFISAIGSVLVGAFPLLTSTMLLLAAADGNGLNTQFFGTLSYYH